MFTGIVKATAKVLSSVPHAGKQEVSLTRPLSFDHLYEGQSIACDGICLTVIAFDTRSFRVEVMRETLHKTTAASWKAASVINLEPALRIGDALDGHWVQGHIDRVAHLLERRVSGSTTYLRFDLPAPDQPLIVPQGSIALNGVSLTVAEIQAASFSVALITHTLENSNLNLLQPGSAVNVEYDVIGKYVLLASSAGGGKLADLL